MLFVRSNVHLINWGKDCHYSAIQPKGDESIQRSSGTSSRLSALAYLSWAAFTGPGGTAHVRFIITWSINNHATMNIIQEINRRQEGRSTKDRLPHWPCVVLNPASDEGKALLGSPNGVGIAYFLVQHKEQLGKMEVARIHLFTSDAPDPEGGSLQDLPSVAWGFGPAQEET
ncbi:hypothetical protein P154DRAFT_70474 [Amniculicola lignicola CBS 123094]|uniref:Uncharacterized protein n=1 Tax=Amniculicola lignicola CBS 123094 TaxID=1392246 RepID=A0A6A5VX89_9PLEO|nr:hypothetical protein P154DRAFT_70474 [Amniculicola lignicola CBS 123094]